MKSLTKQEYIHKALNGGAYKRNSWVLRIFAVSNLRTVEEGPDFDYEPLADGEQYAFQDPETKEFVSIKGLKTNVAMFRALEGIDVTPETTPNVKKPMRVSVGNLVANWIMFIYPFGRKVDFVDGVINSVVEERKIISRLVDDPDDGNFSDDSVIYVNELIRYIDATVNLTGYNKLFVPSATEFTLTPSPEALAFVDEYLKKHKDKLNDPVVIANLTKEVEKLDRAYIDKDPDKGFYQSKKSFAIVRMRMFYLFGIEANFDGKGGYTFIRNSLTEGWDMRRLPEMANSVRDGSFKRGAETALAGEKVKGIFRNQGATVVEQEDCGTKAGLLVKIKDERYVGNTFFIDKKPVHIDKDNFSSYKDRLGYLRNPGMCIHGDDNYCKVCMGDFIRGRENTIAVLSAEPASQMMGKVMAAMHGKVLQTVELELDEVMS